MARANVRWLLLAAAVLGADQLSKWWVRSALPLGGALPLTPFFNLVHAENPGAAFSFLAGADGWQRWLFTALGLGATVVIAALLRKPRRALFGAGLACVLGGALGNAVDRVLHGRVTDFLDFYVSRGATQWHWPAFNLADSAIAIGVALLLLDEWRQSRARTS
jgi:signal peptidase II